MSEVEEKKKEKRDVLEEMLKEEKEHRDTLSDVLQSIIPLMIIPQILPLFQQSLGQTLRETTVNVKVESSAAIIPIDIAAQTAILAVDIKAQSVTLNVRIEGDANVNIVGQSVVLSVGIERSVTLDVNVTNLVLNVNITSVDSDVVFNVSITSIASNVVFNVNIANVTSNVVFNVSIASSILLNVNITGSTTTLNVNITGSTSTLNVSISGQTVDIKIYTPTGRWTTISQTLVTTAAVDSKEAGAGQEVTVISVTGRGRLMNIGIYFFYTAGTPASIYGNAWINIYVDGSLKLSLNPSRLDRMTGYMVDMLRQALTHALFTGISIPYNTNRIGTNPDRYLIRPENVNPKGSLTWAVWNYTNSRYESMGGFINVDEEFFSSLEVKLKNDETAATLAVAVVAMVGGYP